MPLVPDTAEARDLMAAIAPGTYPADIIAAEAKTSAKGNPGLQLTIEVTVDGVTKKRKPWVNVSGAGAIGFDQLLRACHFDELADKYADANLSPKPPFDERMLVGQKIMVVIDQQLYQGEMRDNVKGYLKA